MGGLAKGDVTQTNNLFHNSATMAADIEQSLLKELANVKVQKELHIVCNESRKNVLESLTSSSDILEEIITIHKTVTSAAEKKKKSESFSFYQLQFYQAVGKLWVQLAEKTSADRSDVSSVTLFLGKCALELYKDRHLAAKPSTNPDPITRSTGVATTQVNEQKRCVLTFGGGCIGEIWKVNKQRRRPGSRTISKSISFVLVILKILKKMHNTPVYPKI